MRNETTTIWGQFLKCIDDAETMQPQSGVCRVAQRLQIVTLGYGSSQCYGIQMRARARDSALPPSHGADSVEVPNRSLAEASVKLWRNR
jgi:hypothetical protein